MTVHAGPLLGPEADGVCCYDPALDGTTLCGHPADIHILVSTDLGEEPAFSTYSCLEHAEFARVSSIGSHITDAHPVGTQCIGATPETTLWRYSTETVTGACIERTEHTVTSKFIGRRRSTEASVVLSSVEVAVQRLDAEGDAVGEEIELGRLVVNKEGQSVGLELPGDDQAQGAPGFKLFVRERGRESRTNVLELLFEDTLVPEEPTPDYETPTAPSSLDVDDITRTSLSLAWGPATDNVAVAHYEIRVDGVSVANASGPNGGSMHLAQLPDPEDGVISRLVQVRAVDTSGNQGAWVERLVSLPPREPEEPEPEPARRDATNTGVPAGVTLTDYTGSGSFGAGTVVIEGKRLTEETLRNGYIALQRGAHVTLRNCYIGTRIDVDGDDRSLTMEDCEVDGRGGHLGVGYNSLVLRRVNVHNALICANLGSDVLIEDSYIHHPYNPDGQDKHVNPLFHGGGGNIVVRRSTFWAPIPDNDTGGGVTTNLSLFPDFAPVHDVTVEDCFIGWTHGAYGVTLGWNPGKSFNDHPLNGTGMVFRRNTFERGPSGRNAVFGPVTSWPPASVRPGNIWEDNRYEDGEAILPS